MTEYFTENVRIRRIKELAAPRTILGEIPATRKAALIGLQARREIHRILQGRDSRLLVVIGPSCIHDPRSALAYAGRLAEIKKLLQDQLVIVMRTYLEMPGSARAWRGLINNPDLDERADINRGLRVARMLLRDINQSGIPVATEYHDPLLPPYLSDLVAWGQIGAPAVESHLHRQLASGLSCPIGFGHRPDGAIRSAVEAVVAAGGPHHFPYLTKAGRAAIVTTAGNRDCHIILRGGGKHDVDPAGVEAAGKILAGAGLAPRMMVDLGTSGALDDYRRQLEVGRKIAAQIGAGDNRIIGVMIRSYLLEGKQRLLSGQPLVSGLSITDACLGWLDSEHLLHALAKAVILRKQYGSGGRGALEPADQPIGPHRRRTNEAPASPRDRRTE